MLRKWRDGFRRRGGRGGDNGGPAAVTAEAQPGAAGGLVNVSGSPRESGAGTTSPELPNALLLKVTPSAKMCNSDLPLKS